MSFSASRQGEAAAGRGRVHRGRLQPRPQPLPDDAGAGTRRAGRRRPEHDRRGREPGHPHRRRPPRPPARRAGRADPGQQGQGAGRAARAPWPRPPSTAGRRKGPPFPEAFEREVAALRQAGRRRTCRRSWCAGCCSTWAATPRSGSSIASAPTVAEQVQAARQRLAAAGCPAPGRRGAHPLRLDSRGDGRLRAAARPSGSSPGPTASTAC